MNTGTQDASTGLFFADKVDAVQAQAQRDGKDSLVFADGKHGRPTANLERAANAAGMPSGADLVLQEYLALPVSERQRFMLLWNQSEEDFTLKALQAVNKHVNRLGIDLNDRGAFDRSFRAVGRGPFNRGVEPADRFPAEQGAEQDAAPVEQTDGPGPDTDAGSGFDEPSASDQDEAPADGMNRRSNRAGQRRANGLPPRAVGTLRGARRR